MLLVDEYNDLREMYVEYLRCHGLRVEPTSSGELAIEIAVALAPDVIVMDLAVPDSGEPPSAGRVIGFASPRALAVVAFNADGLQQPSGERRDAGRTEVVMKPCPPERLLALVLAALRARERAARPCVEGFNRRSRSSRHSSPGG